MVNYTTSELTPLIMKGAGVGIQGTATTTLFTSARGIVSPLRNDKGTGAEMHAAIVSGIDG